MFVFYLCLPHVYASVDIGIRLMYVAIIIVLSHNYFVAVVARGHETSMDGEV